jgi:tripartite-type tricarboxylate transporter receptor subunit TctC
MLSSAEREPDRPPAKTSSKGPAMKVRLLATVVGLMAALSTGPASTAQAQKFPSRPIIYVVPLAAGSTTDVAARLIAQRVSQSIGVSIIIENKPGASTMVGSSAVAKAEPDGHTLLMGASSLTVNQNLFKTVPFDTERDFAPISLLVTAPVVLVVTPRLGVTTLKDFLARFRPPHSVTFATPGPGTMLGLATEVFRLRSSLDVKVAVYRGGGPALTDVVAGHVDAMFGTPVIKQNIDKGDVRALAVSGAKRLDLLPDVPTFAEVGLPMPEVDAGAWFGLFAPAGVPADVIDALNRAFNAALKDAELRSALAKMGLEPRGTTPEEFGSFIREEIQRWPPIFQRAGIVPQ